MKRPGGYGEGGMSGDDGKLLSERLLENAEILWHAFLFTAIIYSYYESYIAIKFGKSIMRIEKVIHKVSKKK